MDGISNSTFSINDDQYEIILILKSGVQTLPISYSIVRYMEIEESIFDWHHKGHLIYENHGNVFERPPTVRLDNGEFIDLSPLTYTYRNDGRDLLYVIIRPTYEGTPILDPELWHIQHEFAIYDTEDLIINGKKHKKIFFWDYEYQLMKDRTVEWSTAYHPEAKKPYGRVKSGKAIQHFIEYALSPIPQTFNEWDDGELDIFWTCPCESLAEENLHVLLRKHISETPTDSEIEKDLSILHRHRFTKEWNLIPVNKYFERSTEGDQPGELQREHFYLHELQDDIEDGVTEQLSPKLGKPSFERDIDRKSTSDIYAYQFSHISGIDNAMAFRDVVSHEVDLTSGKFMIWKEETDMETFRTKWLKPAYTDKLFLGENSEPMLMMNKSKHGGLHIHSQFDFGNTEKDRGFNQTKNALIQKYLLLNANVNFKVKGMTCRESCVWIALDMETANTANNFDRTFLGQWFVTHLKHIFIENKYINDITAVKIDHKNGTEVWENLKEPEDKLW